MSIPIRFFVVCLSYIFASGTLGNSLISVVHNMVIFEMIIMVILGFVGVVLFGLYPFILKYHISQIRMFYYFFVLSLNFGIEMILLTIFQKLEIFINPIATNWSDISTDTGQMIFLLSLLVLILPLSISIPVSLFSINRNRTIQDIESFDINIIIPPKR